MARDFTVDALRGLAILTMIAANLAGPVLLEPHPLWLRFYGSFAAPTFVFLSGMMVAFTARAHERRWRYFLARGAAIVLVGALVDVGIWQIYPFTSVDVLYLIGLALPLSALVRPSSQTLGVAVALLVFLVTPILQSALGYTPYPTELHLNGRPTVVVHGQSTLFQHWLVDGFFPVFPWVGFSLLGACLARRRWRGGATVSFARGLFPAASLVLLASGAFIWWRWPGPLLTRGGYSEMFYPPTLGFAATALGVIGIGFWVGDLLSARCACDPLRALGASSLAIYILHLMAIRFALKPLWPRVELPTFIALYATLAASMIAAAYGLRALKRHWRPRMFLLGVVLGG